MSADNWVPTSDDALKNAARLLANAELETDLSKMERLEKLADSWIDIAGMLLNHARETS